jgi:hypothetical protein
VVVVNVGGCRYWTTVGTLCCVPVRPPATAPYIILPSPADHDINCGPDVM